MEELKHFAPVDISEYCTEDHRVDPEASKFRVNGYEDYLSPSNILQPKHRTLYGPETEPEYSNEHSALETLLQKDPSELIRPEKERIVILLRAQGLSINEICKRVEWSKPTVLKTIRKFAKDISQLKRTELEELLQN